MFRVYSLMKVSFNKVLWEDFDPENASPRPPADL